MAGVTAANLNYTMKHHYLPRIRKALNDSNVFLKIAQKAEKTDFHGRSIVVKHKYGRTAGMTRPSAASGTFPAATESKYIESTIPLARALGTVQVSDEDMLRAEDNAYALVQPLEEESQDLIDFMQRETNAMFIRGTNGALATVSAFSNGTPDTVTVDDTSLLEPGMLIDFYDTSGSTELANGGDITITAILSATTFSCTMTGTPASGDTIHLANSRGNEPVGLIDIISASASLQGVAATSGYWWQANVDSTSSLADFSPKKLKILLNTCKRRVRRNKFVMMSDRDVATAMGWVLMGGRSYMNTTKWEGFWDSITFDGMPVVIEDDCMPNKLFVIDKRGLVYGVLGGKLVNIVDSDGSATRLALSSGARTAAWVMNFTSYGQLGCTDRRGHGLYPYINGLSTSGNTYATLGGYEN